MRKRRLIDHFDTGSSQSKATRAIPSDDGWRMPDLRLCCPGQQGREISFNGRGRRRTVGGKDGSTGDVVGRESTRKI